MTKTIHIDLGSESRASDDDIRISFNKALDMFLPERSAENREWFKAKLAEAGKYETTGIVEVEIDDEP